MNTAQFWALAALIQQELHKAEDEENAAGVIACDGLLDALCDLMAKAKGVSPQQSLQTIPTEASSGLYPASILQLSAASREGKFPKVPQQEEDTVVRFEELRAAYRKACTRSVAEWMEQGYLERPDLRPERPNTVSKDYGSHQGKPEELS